MVSTKIDSSELATYSVVANITKHVDGKVAASEILGASRHPKMRIIRAFAMLLEIPDATASTYTVILQNAGTSMTDTLTFTQGTDIVGKTKDFTMVSNQDVILAASALTFTTAGTTTTAGEILISFQYELTN